MGNALLIESLSEPLNGTAAAKVDIDCATGHLTIDRLTGGEQVLATGALQYFEKQGAPNRYVSTSSGHATLALKAGSTGQPWFRFPWAACGGAYQWYIHLNPAVSSDITAHSDGGNVKLDLAGMAITRVSAESSGGNMEVVLPENAANLVVTTKTGGGNIAVDVGCGIQGANFIEASSGAGNVTVRIPSGVAVRIHASSGLGKVIVDPRFSKTEKNIYQSPDYDGADNRLEITVRTGAGNLNVTTK